MSTLRLFIGLPLPGSYQELLGHLRRQWRPRLRSRLSWTRPGNWHVTLKFLGDTGEAMVPALRGALASVAWAPYELQGGGGGFFPPPLDGRPIRPRVVWAGMQRGAQETTALAGAVQAALTPLGIAADERPFRPHLTLARVKAPAAADGRPGSDGRPSGSGWAGLLAELQRLDWPAVPVDSFTLWQSTLSPEGPTYKPLARFPAERKTGGLPAEP